MMRNMQVFWRLDFTENPSRMRRFLRRNYKGSEHIGAAASYEENRHQLISDDKSGQCQTIPESNISANFTSSTSIIVAAAMSLEEGERYEEQTESEIADADQNNGSKRKSASYELYEKGDSQILLANKENLSHTELVVAPGFVPSESDERIMYELPSLMVRPLKAVRGTFQVN